MMLITAALILIITCDAALGRDHEVPVKGILDMALNSVDDQYDGCSKNMSDLVKTKYLHEEISVNKSGFGKAWRDGEEKNPGPRDDLTRNNCIAISVYTGSKVHNEFINAVRIGKQAYKKQTFKWYSLHFFLTEAMQSLKKTQKKCKVTYRGTRDSFEQRTFLKKEIRFGSFASSSLNKNEAKRFGNLSCFEIYTCHGADVTKYSEHRREKEVLIPPYEKFIVTAIRTGQNGDWCKTVYTLKSSGIQSNLNCAVASIDSQ
ncbi:ecto-ADP-ribosyltransferase 4-like [Triplophysa dalaica]|uniref:ecto-ADP-ribosyltransferase 4-like n=1 Tax=Triplophysa dalaica TaxID=1582913 RepID=UPI0024DF880A|nr:ecto-ADP-ribosyltransferase 4-like [Triplophysa dalaica]